MILDCRPDCAPTFKVYLKDKPAAGGKPAQVKNEYTTKREPAYCDRILYCTRPGLEQCIHEPQFRSVPRFNGEGEARPAPGPAPRSVQRAL